MKKTIFTLSVEIFCIDKGHPSLDYADQNDLDTEPRWMGEHVEIGADEISPDCNDVYHPYDWNADGIVNLNEFRKFSDFWLAHDPNDPAVLDPNNPANDPNSPSYIKPSQLEAWYPDGRKYNFSTESGSLYSIDVSDLLIFLDESPWLWVACWRHDIQDIQQMSMLALGGDEEMTGGGEQTMLSSFESSQSFEVTIPAISESIETAPLTESIEAEIFDPVVERATILSLLEGIDEFINAGGEDAQAWQEMKNILVQSLADIEDMMNDLNEI